MDFYHYFLVINFKLIFRIAWNSLWNDKLDLVIKFIKKNWWKKNIFHSMMGNHEISTELCSFVQYYKLVMVVCIFDDTIFPIPFLFLILLFYLVFCFADFNHSENYRFQFATQKIWILCPLLQGNYVTQELIVYTGLQGLEILKDNSVGYFEFSKFVFYGLFFTLYQLLSRVSWSRSFVILQVMDRSFNFLQRYIRCYRKKKKIYSARDSHFHPIVFYIDEFLKCIQRSLETASKSVLIVT